MARRTLSLRGRILAAGASVAATGALIGLMATGGHPADASSPSSSSAATSRAGDPTSATPNDPQSSTGGGSTTSGDASSTQQPQPQTRTGGS